MLPAFLALSVVLSSTGFSTAQVVDSTWPDPVANDVLPYGQLNGPAVTHGPVLGHVTRTSVRVWVRTSEPMTFRIVYSASLPLRPGTTGVEGATHDDADNTGWVELSGLRPGTRYYYGVVIELDGERCLVDTRMVGDARWPSFRTLPDPAGFVHEKYNPEGLFNVCFATACCNSIIQPRYDNTLIGFKHLRENHGDELMFFLNNGDNIYEVYRTRDNRPHFDWDLFRSDYKYYLDHAVHLAAFNRFVPQVYMYDDHEVGSDLEGTGQIGLKKGKWLARDIGLGPWYEYQGWANPHGAQHQPIVRGTATVAKDGDVLHDADADFTTLRAEAVSNIHVAEAHASAGSYGLVEVVDQHRLRVTPKFAADEKVAYSIGTHHYYDFEIANCHYFVLDTRGERAQYDPDKVRDPGQFILGETQKKWLRDGIAASTADFVFISSSVPWMVFHTDFHVAVAHNREPRVSPKTGRSYKEDGFTGALVEREELIDFFDGLDKQVIILTGDLHCAFAIQITDNVWEFMMGPMGSGNHTQSTAGYPPRGGWFDSEGRQVLVKWMAAAPDEVPYFRSRANYYGVIHVNNVQKASGPKDGEALWIAYDKPQVVLSFYDAHSGKLVYAEGISTAQTKP